MTNENDKQKWWLALDLFMVLVVMFNLVWIVFDWVYSSLWVQALFTEWLPWLVVFYNPIHADFVRYDLFFVVFFLLEFFFRWVVSVWRQEHFKWFFYPFLHWYDLLGCIPVGGFRWLRVLRIVFITTRLQRLGFIRMQNWQVTQWLVRYYDIFVEEVSDRVVINVIKEAQDETRSGLPIGDKILDKVVKPHKAQLIELLMERVQRVVAKNFAEREADLRAYLETLVKGSTERNAGLKMVSRVPLLGRNTLASLEQVVVEMLMNVVQQAVHDFTDIEQFSVLDQLTDDLLDGISAEGGLELERIVAEIVYESLEIIKERVAVQRWKQQHFGMEF